MMNDEEYYRPFVVGAIIGCILWSISGGFIHAYIICPDWEAMGPNSINALLGWRPFTALVCTGFIFGLSVEVAKFIGAVLRSQAASLFFPVIAGALIGTLQGNFIIANWWGFESQVLFKEGSTRLWSGAVCGFILSVPTIMIGIVFRRSGNPW